MATTRTLRTAEIGQLLDTFLVAAVVSVLMIRFQLFVADYPTLGGRDLHIAHLLYGGLLMMVALIVMLSFLTSWSKRFGALLGGIGFGFFIDELGKFITRDNNYFFKPTASLIYLIFIVIYLITQALLIRRGLTQREYLVNALEYLKEAAAQDLDQHEQRRALAYLKRADPRDPLVKPVHRLLKAIEPIRPRRRNFINRTATKIRNAYFSLLRRDWFENLIVAVFVLLGVISFVEVFVLVFAISDALLDLNAGAVLDQITNRVGRLSFTDWATLLSSLAAGMLIIAGVYSLHRSRLASYRLFDRALLIFIFITQFFAFAKIQFTAAIILALNLVLLVGIRYMIKQEQHTLPD